MNKQQLALALLAAMVVTSSPSHSFALGNAMGTRSVEAIVEYDSDGNVDECGIAYKSGANVEDDFKATIVLSASPTHCSIHLDGSGGSSSTKEGQEATVARTKERGKIIKEALKGISKGAVRGFTGGIR